jgi:hypothetical protein
MTKKMSLMIAAILLIVVLGIGAFLFTRSAKPKTDQAVSTSESTPAPTEAPVAETKGSFKDLLAQKKDVSCTMSDPSTQSSGTIFVSSPKFRGDMTVAVNNQPMETHMISDGTYMHIWQEGTTRGTKFKVDINQTPAPATGSAQTQVTDLNKEVNLKCDPWTVDASKFTLPTNVQFSDLSTIMKSPGKPGGSTPIIDKSVCDNIADAAAKAACVKALGG